MRLRRRMRAAAPAPPAVLEFFEGGRLAPWADSGEGSAAASSDGVKEEREDMVA